MLRSIVGVGAVLVVGLGLSVGCMGGGDGGNAPIDVCPALCACVEGAAMSVSAGDTCRTQCAQRVSEHATEQQCRDEIIAAGVPICADHCSPDGSGGGGAAGSGTGGTGTGGTGVMPCSGFTCAESHRSRQACHSDCDFSGYCWDVCEQVTDHNATNATCSDDLDNDSDGHTDCDDEDCRAAASICAGSSGTGGIGGTGGSGGTGGTADPGCVSMVMATGSNQACGECLCTGCLTEMIGCQGNADTTWASQCAAVIDCCAAAGNLSGSACYMAGCNDEVDVAGGGATAVAAGSCMPIANQPPANACQASTLFGSCSTSKCPACQN